MYWYNKFYRTCNSIETLMGKGNIELANRYEDTLKELVNMLPHGSGIDDEYTYSVSKNKIVLSNAYHVMSENGYYVGWVHFNVVITPSLAFGYDLKITGNFGKNQHLKDYLYDVYNEALSQEVG